MTTRRSFLKTALLGGTAASTASLARADSTTPDTKIVDRRTLGRTGAEVSILGLGLGSAFTRPYDADRETGQALLQKALDHGINYWDTCRGYGPSEEMIAPMVEKNRDQIFLVSKSGARDYDGFMREAEESLKTLRTDYFDTLNLWNLTPEDSIDEMYSGAFKAISKLRDEGVARSIGVTGHSGSDILIAAIERFDPDTILTVLPCTRDDNGRYEDEVLPLARKRDMGVIAMKTVRRARNADLIGSDLIRYALSLEGVATTIVGLDTIAHLNENVEMATNFQPLSSSQRTELHAAATSALRNIPTPWEQPGYVDGSLA